MDRILATTAPANSIIIDEASYWGPYFVRENRGGGNLDLIDADGDARTVWFDYDESVSVCALDADADAVSDFA